MLSQPVPLSRSFSRVHFKDRDNQDFSDYFTGPKNLSWSDLESESRCVILAEAGAGKTFEMTARAQHISDRGDFAFFIRIEDIDDDFESAFEVGCSKSFTNWMQDTSRDAWFFLDSVDESRLKQHRDFEKAIRRFGRKIHSQLHRAKIILSSRPHAWRSDTDAELIQQHLPFENKSSEGQNPQNPEKRELHVYRLDQLTISDIRQFAECRSTPDIDRAINEIQRLNLISTAARPFDLEVILNKWKIDQCLGGRLEMLQHNINERLKEIAPNRKPILSREKAREGAQVIAAALVLSGAKGIAVPPAKSSAASETLLDPESILESSWSPEAITELLSRGVFDDVVYGAVRFRHREIRELLAAEWFQHHYENGNSRHFTEGLFIREQYDKKVIPPRMRPVLPWLILFNDDLRKKVLKIDPNIAIEGGDPAHLPISVRVSILNDIVERISKKQNQSIHSNDAILLIAQRDLSERVKELIIEHSENDDVLFFLGRLVWQGEMENCLPLLAEIAANENSGIYPRVVAIRACMQCGDLAMQKKLWQRLNNGEMELQGKIFEELIESTNGNRDNIDLLLVSLTRIEPYREYEHVRAIRLLRKFVDDIVKNNESTVDESLYRLVKGFVLLLSREPHIKRNRCEVSSDYRWLISPALYAVEKLVKIKSSYAISEESLGLMRKAPIAESWCGHDRDECRNQLFELVPAWYELNDALFWYDVTETRNQIISESKDKLTGVSRLDIYKHYWKFEIDRFQDILKFIEIKEGIDDKLIAQSLAVQLLSESRCSSDRKSLEIISNQFSELSERLTLLLNPVKSEEIIKYEEEHARWNAEYERSQREDAEKRSQWIERLKSDPNLLLRPPTVKPGEITNYQHALMGEIQNTSPSDSKRSCSEWRSLIPEFGIDVANAYKRAAIEHWKHYNPPLRSEGCDPQKIPYALCFSLSGIEIESAEQPDFFLNLSNDEVKRALRYVTWELNGFPKWFEAIHAAHPELTLNAILVELEWDILNTPTGVRSHYILHDIAYHAPWLHSKLTAPIIEILRKNEIRNLDVLQYCIDILGRGGIESGVVGDLAVLKIDCRSADEPQAFWHSLLVSTDPVKGISATKKWIDSLPETERQEQAQQLIVNLMGGRTSGPSSYWEDYKKAPYLQELYLFACQYIRVEDDLDRSSGGVYSPGLRDHAQDARNRLLSILQTIPGKETFIALHELANQHPEPVYREWMLELAYNRAVQDADLDSWSAEQIRDYDEAQTLVPLTHRQLYDVALSRLVDFKSWIERGNDSPYATLQKIKDETEMRNFVAGWFNQHASTRYKCAQEYEFPNGQRPDILFQSNYVNCPVPVELKLLDNGWSGPDLCKSLENQLVRDYLREAPKGCGIMLLMWRGEAAKKTWDIDGKMATLQALGDALEKYWMSISNNYPNIGSIKVVVIDLTVREHKANT